MLLIVQLSAEPSRHRVAVWRELRRAGAVPVSAGTWGMPAGPAFQPAVDRAAELCHKGGGVLAVIDASPRDEASAMLIETAYRAARVDEWNEFEADCGKFEAEIAREIAKQKFTFGELEEEEQSLERLRRWYLDLMKRDVLGLPEAHTAEQRLHACESVLEGYAEMVYDVMRGTTPTADTPATQSEQTSL
ncbi:Chromate resistance protein ChrB [Subtercola boreus]|uniref:Chromate resistance protein ChrB n=1 Tax=Subtercola boreus TaxID=120213 RepID=UPI001C0F1802|nr:Chromate resistance protein ChrB [Subtercola boreus]